MHCERKVTADWTWVGADDRRLAMFEGVYSVPRGVSYNAYLLQDEKTVLMDTVDHAVSTTILENLAYALRRRPLDYVLVQHMEPDHSDTLQELLLRHPEATVVCNKKVQGMLRQFYDLSPAVELVEEGAVLETGRHSLRFFMAPMVHWP